MSSSPDSISGSKLSTVNSTPPVMTNLPSAKRRKCRPGYKSPAKLARSKERTKYFHIVANLKQENACLKNENIDLKTECIKIKSSFDALQSAHEEQKDILAKTSEKTNLKHLNLKKELNAAYSKINSLEEFKIKNEEKLQSYRGTLRKMIIEQKGGNIKDKAG